MAKIVSRGDPIEPVYLNNLRVAAHGWGVVSGLVVSERGAGANMSVDVAAGVAWINERKVTKTSTTNVAITAAHASYDRYDLVVINSSGTISVIDGTAAATSYANDYDLETNNAILLAEVYVPATDTTIEDAQITDKQIISFVEEINSAIDVGLEEYSNHLGATDNFTETLTNGNGTATADTTNHEMDVDSGITVVGHAVFQSKDSPVLSTKPIICNFLVQNINNGELNKYLTFVGLKNDFTSVNVRDIVGFYLASNNTWYVTTGNGSANTDTSISAISNGDVLTIVVDTSTARFYKNGAFLGSHTTNIPTAALHLGVGTVMYSGAVGSSRRISVDMMGVKIYH